MRRKLPFPWLPLGLMVVCIGLVWVAYERLHASSEGAAPESLEAKIDPSVVELPATPTFALPPATRYAEISQRPLFSQSRRPPDIAADVASEAAAVDLGVTLQGIVVAGPNRIAIFKDAATGEMLRLKRNDRFKGWQLSQVSGQGVVFLNNDKEQRLELDYEQAPPAQPNRRRKTQLTNAQRQQQLLQQQQLQLQQLQLQQQQQQPVAQRLKDSGVLPDDGEQPQ